MKKIILVILLLATVAAAQTDLKEPGITPDSMWYGLDVAWDDFRVSRADTFEEKSQLRLEIAEERASEYMAMAENNNTKGMAKAAESQKQQFVEIERIRNESEQARMRVQERMQEHVQKLEQVREQVPEQAQKGLDTAIENANKTSDKGLKALAQAQGKSVSELRNDIAEKLGKV